MTWFKKVLKSLGLVEAKAAPRKVVKKASKAKSAKRVVKKAASKKVAKKKRR